MADNDEVNDEYQFTELDPLNPNVVEEESLQSASSETNDTGSRQRVLGEAETNVKRNALIAVLVFIALMLGYKFIGSFFFGSKDGIGDIKAPVTAPAPVPIQPTPIEEAPPSAPAPVPQLPVPQPNAELKSNLSSLALGQENLNAQISTVGSQIDNMNAHMDMLTTKINELSSVIASLNAKLENQSQVIQRLTAKQVVKEPRHPMRSVRHFEHYFIQAVIPGRAWLVAENGSTLTVREGSNVPGYGRVKLIDPHEGRVMTSSGLVIRFSQNDS